MERGADCCLGGVAGRTERAVGGLGSRERGKIGRLGRAHPPRTIPEENTSCSQERRLVLGCFS